MNDYSEISEIVSSLQRYVKYGIPCGGFLNACLENNFMEAVSRADHYNRQRLPLIAEYIYNYIPHSCHGSREVVVRWMETRAEDFNREQEQTASGEHTTGFED